MASELIAEAITDYFGERCLDYAEGCPTCEAWAEYDRWNTRAAPAATDTGLVTVAYETWDGDLVYRFNGPCNKDDALVYRSQAEELLAAERAEKEQAKGDLTRVLVHFVREHFPENTTFKPFDDLIGLITQFDNASTIAREYASRIHVLEADNAAQDARIKELEKINANLMGDDEDRPRYTTKRLKLEISRATEALEAKLAAAEKDAATWEANFKALNAKTARAVLGGKPS